MKIITIILASLLLIFRYCTMEPEEYEFVTIKNNSNIPLVCILENEEPLEDFKFVDRESETALGEYDVGKMFLAQTRQDVFKKKDNVVFWFFPMDVFMKQEAGDSLINYPEEIVLKIVKCNKRELETLNWTITYP